MEPVKAELMSDIRVFKNLKNCWWQLFISQICVNITSKNLAYEYSQG